MNFVHACACEHVCAHISQRASHPLTCMACSRFSVDVVKPWRVRLGTKGWSDAQMHSSMFVRACTYMCIRNTILHYALYLSCGLILAPPHHNYVPPIPLCIWVWVWVWVLGGRGGKDTDDEIRTLIIYIHTYNIWSCVCY